MGWGKPNLNAIDSGPNSPYSRPKWRRANEKGISKSLLRRRGSLVPVLRLCPVPDWRGREKLVRSASYRAIQRNQISNGQQGGSGRRISCSGHCKGPGRSAWAGEVLARRSLTSVEFCYGDFRQSRQKRGLLRLWRSLRLHQLVPVEQSLMDRFTVRSRRQS